MGSSKKIASAVAWSVIANIVNAVYGFIVAPICIKYFGKADYGLIALAMSVNGYMQIMDMGLASTNVRFFANWLANGDENQVNRLMQTCTAFYGIVGIVNAIVLGVLACYVQSVFNVTAEQAAIFRDLLLMLAGVAIMNWYASCFGQIISATENVAWGQKCMLLTKLMMVGVLVFTFVFKLSLAQFFFATQLVGLAVIPLNIYKVRKVVPFVGFYPRFHWQTFRTILPYSLNIFSFGVFQFLFYQSRTVFLGVRATPEMVTEYNVMNGIAGLTTAVSAVFLNALLPSSSRVVAKGDRTNFDRVAYQGTKFISVSSAFCGFGLITVCDDLLMVYVGESFVHLAPWLMLWLFTIVLTSHNQCISSLILAGSNIRAITINTIAASLVGILLTWAVIPTLGPGGPVIGFLVYGACQIFFYWFYYWPQVMRISTLKVVMVSFLPYVLLGGVLAFGLRTLPHFTDNWLNVFVFGLLFAVAYGFFSWLFFNKQDREFILGVLRIGHLGR